MYFKILLITLYLSFCSASPIGADGLVPSLFGSRQDTGNIGGATNIVNNGGGATEVAPYNPWVMGGYQPMMGNYPPAMMPMQPQAPQTYFIQDPVTNSPSGPLSRLNSASISNDPLPPSQTI